MICVSCVLLSRRNRIFVFNVRRVFRAPSKKYRWGWVVSRVWWAGVRSDVACVWLDESKYVVVCRKRDEALYIPALFPFPVEIRLSGYIYIYECCVSGECCASRGLSVFPERWKRGVFVGHIEVPRAFSSRTTSVYTLTWAASNGGLRREYFFLYPGSKFLID